MQYFIINYLFKSKQINFTYNVKKNIINLNVTCTLIDSFDRFRSTKWNHDKAIS